METATREELLKRLSFVQGHLEGIQRMLEEERSCVDVLKQTYAVRSALTRIELLLLRAYIEIGPGAPGQQHMREVGELRAVFGHWSDRSASEQEE